MCDTEDGWVKDEGAWYYYCDGEVTTGWKNIDGDTYYFNKPGGSMGWSKEVDGKYLGSDGRQVKDERWVNTEEDKSGTWYYVGSKEENVTGWNKIGDDFHYFNYPGGSMTWDNTIDGFYLDNDGKIASGTGWLKDEYSGKWYYFSDGEMKTGWVQDGDSWYYLKADGTMATGLQDINGDTYYFYSDGEMGTGWEQDSNNIWHYFYGDGNGSMAHDTTIGGYHVDKSGKMITGTGWVLSDGSWYYLKDDGEVATDWLYNQGNWYYLYPEGSMAGDTTVNGYYVDASGKWIPDGVGDSNDKEMQRLKNKGENGEYWNEYYTRQIENPDDMSTEYIFDVKVSDEYEHYILTCDRDAGETPMSIEDYVNTMGPKWEYIYNHKTQADRNSELAADMYMGLSLVDPLIAAGDPMALSKAGASTEKLSNEYEANSEKLAETSEKEMSEAVKGAGEAKNIDELFSTNEIENLKSTVIDEGQMLKDMKWGKRQIYNDELGPAIAGVYNKRNGKIYTAINDVDGKIPAELSPTIGERIDNMPDDIYDSYIEHTKGAGSHAEVYAVNKALLDDPNATADDLLVYVNRTLGTSKPVTEIPFKTCPHCEYILKGFHILSNN